MSAQEDDLAWQIFLEQERDMKRACVEVSAFLKKCRQGMQTRDDCDEAEDALKVLGVDV